MEFNAQCTRLLRSISAQVSSLLVHFLLSFLCNLGSYWITAEFLGTSVSRFPIAPLPYKIGIFSPQRLTSKSFKWAKGVLGLHLSFNEPPSTMILCAPHTPFSPSSKVSQYIPIEISCILSQDPAKYSLLSSIIVRWLCLTLPFCRSGSHFSLHFVHALVTSCFLVTSSSLPRHFLVTSSSLPRHFLVTSSSLPRHFLVTSCFLVTSSSLPRHFLLFDPSFCRSGSHFSLHFFRALVTSCVLYFWTEHGWSCFSCYIPQYIWRI